MFNSKIGNNSFETNKIITLVFLIVIFITIAGFVLNNNFVFINLDNPIHNWTTNHQYPSMYNFMLSITNIGSVFGSLAIFLVFGLFLFIKNKKNSYIFTLAIILGIILTETIKYTVQRVRPLNTLEQGFSFPSAHAMISTIFLLSSIYLLSPWIKKAFSKNIFLIITSIIFPLVALSRIYLSVHWTTDVIGGIILGSICFVFSEIMYCQKKENVL